MRKIIFVIFIGFLLSSCDRSTLPEKRADYAKEKSGDILIGAVWTWQKSNDPFQNGINLAVKQINAEGGVLGRKIRLVSRDDKNSINQGLSISQQFAANTKMNFVVSHQSSFIAVPALSTYSLAGLLVLESSSTSTQLTAQDYSNIFRIAPNNLQMANYLVDYAKFKNFNRMIIMYVRNEFGRNFANLFGLSAENRGIDIVERVSYPSQSKNYFNMVKDWDEFYHFDALLLIGDLPDAAYIIKSVREAGIHQHIFSDNALFDKSVLDIAGAAANGLVVISNFNALSTDPKIRDFVQAYQREYDIDPTERAAYGYDSIKLLAYAIQQAKSTDVETVSNFLHKMTGWTGVMGTISFDENGDLAKTSNLMKFEVKGNKFQLINSIR